MAKFKKKSKNFRLIPVYNKGVWVDIAFFACIFFLVVFNLIQFVLPSAYQVSLGSYKGKKSEIFTFFNNYTDFEVLGAGNRQVLNVKLRPSKDGESWHSWGVKISKGIPREAELYIDWSVTTNVREIIINIIESSRTTDATDGARHEEYWYYVYRNKDGNRAKITVPLKKFIPNTYQPSGYTVDNVLNTERPFVIMMSLNPEYHKDEVKFNVFSMGLQWENKVFAVLLADFVLLFFTFFLVFQLKIVTPDYLLLKRQVQVGCLVFAVISSLLNPVAEPWALLLIPVCMVLSYILCRKVHHSAFNFIMPLYPFIIIALLRDFPVFIYAGFGFFIFIPFVTYRWFYKTIPLLLYVFYFMVIKMIRVDVSYYYLLLVFVPLFIDVTLNLILQDFAETDKRKMAYTLYQTILKNTNEAILITDEKLRIIAYNRGFLLWAAIEGPISLRAPLADVLPPAIKPDWFTRGADTKNVSIEKNGKQNHYIIKRYEVKEIKSMIYQWFIADITEAYYLQQELDLAYRELQLLVITDELTELANRRKFNMDIDKEWKRGIRNGNFITLAIGDIDFFKQYNDIYGHLKGDEALQDLAVIWKSAARRPFDLAARIGGEEFVLLFPETNPGQVLPVIEELMEELAKKSIPHKGSKVSDLLTISIGLTGMIPVKGLSWEVLYSRADELLYKAKLNGRNRIEWEASYSYNN